MSARQEAERILRRMRDVYAGCATYRDTGTAETLYVLKDGMRFTDQAVFSTCFSRGTGLRFEASTREGDEVDRCVVRRSGRDVRFGWRGVVETVPSIRHALVRASDSCGGASCLVPMLLVADELHEPWLPSPVLFPVALTLLEESSLAGVPCHRIADDRDRTTLWIDRERLLLRRVEERCRDDDPRTEVTLDLAPELDVPFGEHELLFDPRQG